MAPGGLAVARLVEVVAGLVQSQQVRQRQEGDDVQWLWGGGESINPGDPPCFEGETPAPPSPRSTHHPRGGDAGWRQWGCLGCGEGMWVRWWRAAPRQASPPTHPRALHRHTGGLTVTLAASPSRPRPRLASAGSDSGEKPGGPWLLGFWSTGVGGGWRGGRGAAGLGPGLLGLGAGPVCAMLRLGLAASRARLLLTSVFTGIGLGGCRSPLLR